VLVRLSSERFPAYAGGRQRRAEAKFKMVELSLLLQGGPPRDVILRSNPGAIPARAGRNKWSKATNKTVCELSPFAGWPL